MKRQVVLTVSESKRLIAKGVAIMPEVRKATKEGMVVVATGTTNSYVLEELWGKKIDKRRYKIGITAPKMTGAVKICRSILCFIVMYFMMI